ncbi:MAG: Transcriptional regulator, AcrR family [uncultured Rubrobacteraceae bacterium]|uniref:Transcriptional regulator, AcrR family n=1 Tax=uncultured Rubrobacteraceae bacterium TaxID=349277 RepID=A0A6J4P0Q2_9ACTN|nr:MAG: Transcriptional regulator, AcrR family [uncultured Rubrobacteraceae bacterium]
MARTKEFEPERVLERAMELFWRRGYEATSLRELLEAMGIGQGSFYGTFGDKHALFLAALDRYREAAEADAVATLEDGSPKEAIRAVFGGMVDVLAGQEEPRRGCFLANSAVELAPHDAEVGVRISRYVRRLEDTFERTIRRGQATDEIDARRDPRTLARSLVNNSLGLRVLARTGTDRRTLQDAADAALWPLG